MRIESLEWSVQNVLKRWPNKQDSMSSDLGISFTGVAGQVKNGKEVGTIFVALASGQTSKFLVHLARTRNDNREFACGTAC